MNPEEIDKRLLQLLGEHQLMKHTNYCFDFACEEADYLGVPQKGKSFFRLVVFRTTFLRMELLELMEDYAQEEGYDTSFQLTFPTPKEMKEGVKDEYERE